MNIELVHMEKTFPDSTPLKDISCKIYEGDTIAVIGPSGSGKTTFLRCLNLLDAPSQGKIIVDGQEISARKHKNSILRLKTGMVFQSSNLFEHLTVLENVMRPLRDVKKLSRQEAYNMAIEQLRLVGLERQILQYPESLSEGQKKCACIARTLALDPEVVLFDEPTEGLDPNTIHEIVLIIQRLKKANKTMVIVTHNLSFAKKISDRIFYLDHGELYEEGLTKEIFNDPVRERTKAFIKQLRIFTYKSTPKELNPDDLFREYNSYILNNGINSIISGKVDAYLTIIINIVRTLDKKDHLFNIIMQYDESKKMLTVLWYLYERLNKIDEFRETMKSLIGDQIVDYIELIEDEDYNLKVSLTFNYANKSN